MFTGLIESIGEIVEVTTTTLGTHVRIRSVLSSSLTPGESLAVNGVCLTVTMAADGDVHADIGPETARVTTLGAAKPAQLVNLERSMRADNRFGGHFVQGHVDGRGLVEATRVEGDARWLTIAFPAALAAYFVHKGSIAVDGISLTVARLGDTQFDVMIVPYTWEHTNLSALKRGDAVNLECDIVGKYVVRAVELSDLDRIRRTGQLQ